jgi:hypothetical protein
LGAPAKIISARPTLGVFEVVVLLRAAYDVLVSAEWEELHRLVDELPEDEVAEALRLVHRRQDRTARPWPPAWFGAGRGSRTDVAARSEEILRDGFGRDA